MAENELPQGAQAKHEPAGENALATTISQKADKFKFLFLGLLVVLAVAIAIFSHIRGSSAKRAADSANSVFKSTVDLYNKPAEEAVAVFGKAARDYVGLPAGIQASVYEFGRAMEAKKYDVAERAARDFIKNYPRNPLVDRFKLGLAQALTQQGRNTDAAALLREMTANASSPVFPEAKLALAQTLEKEAEAVREGDKAEYEHRLELAQEEYNDISARSRISVPSQRGFWPTGITLNADYALVQIKDKLAGYEPAEPVGVAGNAGLTPRDMDLLRDLTPPSGAENTADTPGTTDAAAGGENAPDSEIQLRDLDLTPPAETAAEPSAADAAPVGESAAVDADGGEDAAAPTGEPAASDTDAAPVSNPASDAAEEGAGDETPAVAEPAASDADPIPGHEVMLKDEDLAPPPAAAEPVAAPADEAAPAASGETETGEAFGAVDRIRARAETVAQEEVVVQEAVAQEAAVQEAAAQEAIVQEAAAQEAVVQEAVVQEAAAQEAIPAPVEEDDEDIPPPEPRQE